MYDGLEAVFKLKESHQAFSKRSMVLTCKGTGFVTIMKYKFGNITFSLS
jgi:hypothetical protein